MLIMEGLTLEGCQDTEEVCGFLTAYHRVGNICRRKKCWALHGFSNSSAFHSVAVMFSYRVDGGEGAGLL